jgi:dienelactone hydrolase
VTDHPFLVPTAAGPIGAVLSEPDGPRRANVILLEGVAGVRYGVNGVWARVARALASTGVTVLRFDYPGTGDSAMARRPAPGDHGLAREMSAWLRNRTGGGDLILIGSCYGARPAAALAAQEDGAAGLAIVVPYFRARRGTLRWKASEATGRALRRTIAPALDRATRSAVIAAAARVPVWALAGERDRWTPDLLAFCRTLGTPLPIEVSLVPTSLHGQPTIEAQDLTIARLKDWVEQLLAERATA